MDSHTELFDSATYDFLPGFAHWQNDIFYVGENAGYWTDSYAKAQTGLEMFSEVTFDEMNQAQFNKSSAKKIMDDSYIVIIQKS